MARRNTVPILLAASAAGGLTLATGGIAAAQEIPYPPRPAAAVEAFVDPGVQVIDPAVQVQNDPVEIEQAQTTPVLVNETAPTNAVAPANVTFPTNQGNNFQQFPLGGFNQFVPMGWGWPGTGGAPQENTSQTTPVVAPGAQAGPQVIPLGPVGQPVAEEAYAAGPWERQTAPEVVDTDIEEEEEEEEEAPEEYAPEEEYWSEEEDVPADGVPAQAVGPMGGVPYGGAGRLPFTGAPAGIAAVGAGLLAFAVGCTALSVRRRRSSGAQ